MKKLEKILKQKIANNIESNLKTYTIKYCLNIQNNKDRRISKNQYKLLENDLGETDLELKFPFAITTDIKNYNININKEKKYITPLKFKVANKNFLFNTLDIGRKIMNIQNSILFLCKTIYITKG